MCVCVCVCVCGGGGCIKMLDWRFRNRRPLGKPRHKWLGYSKMDHLPQEVVQYQTLLMELVSEWVSEYVSQVEPANTVMKRWVHTHTIASSEMVHVNISLGVFFSAASCSPRVIIVLSLRFRKSLGGKYQSLLHQVMCCCDWDTWQSQLLPDHDTVTVITAQGEGAAMIETHTHFLIWTVSCFEFTVGGVLY